MTANTIIFSVLIFFVCTVHCERTKVTVKLGSINGFKQKIDNKEVNVFLGIPFAKPPIGNLRFRKPQPIIEKWNVTLDATKWPKICMQNTLFFKYFNEISEDCLYLNIWTPVNLEKNLLQNMKPVIVYIHGGGFTYMSSSYKHYNGSVLSAFGDVVVVTLNYRLGAFGFLSAGNADAPGNVGLYDQALALEWVQENIAYFGGDQNKVTLIGQSAGAWSVSLHLLSPVSQDTFNRAIIMSGASFRGVSLDTKDEALRKTLELSKLLGCDVRIQENRVKETHMECLRRVDAEKIVEHQTSPQVSMFSKSLTKLPFVPLIGEVFIPKQPKEMLQQMSFNEGIDLLVGTVANEGFIMHFSMENHGIVPKGDDWREKLRYFIKHSFRNVSNGTINEILHFYFKPIHNLSSDESKLSYYTALGDIHFNCETVFFSEIISKANDFYQYLFDYTLANVTDNLEYCDLQQACHGNEIPLTFGTVSDPKDIAVSKTWMKILTDFAKSGTVGWPKLGQQSSPYYEFTGNKSSDRLLYDFRKEACKLWKPIFQKHY